MSTAASPRHIDDLPDPAVANIVACMPWPHAVAALLVNRRFCECGKAAVKSEVLEQHTATFLSSDRYHTIRATLPSTTKSTIALAFSADRKTLASTHGDHTVKLVDVMRSCIVTTLVGHPRTPWTVKFHPSDPNMVASGCLGGELRIWDSTRQATLFCQTLPHPVISLSFHPDGNKLAAAAGTLLYIWDFATVGSKPKVILKTTASLRCVRFLSANRIIVGVRSKTSNTGMTSYMRAARAQLRLYDFNELAIAHLHDDNEQFLANPTVVVDKALLYNDAGLDVTSDGTSVLTCAEFWLKPDQPPPSPRTPDNVETPATGEEHTEDLEEEQMERKGYVLTAHLVRVALAPQPRDIQCPPSSPPKSRIRYAGQDDGPLSPMDLAEPSAEATQLSSLPPISTGTASTPQAMEVDGEGTSSYAAGGEALPAYQSKILKSAALDGLWGGVQGGTFVTSVKLSPTGSFVLLGCSRGNTENQIAEQAGQHPVAAIWRLGDMARMETLSCGPAEEDDANVALFHPEPGAGVVYGTKQGQIVSALNAESLMQSGADHA